MAVTDFVAAIEFSSTRMYGIAGKTTETKSLQVLAFYETSATSYMKKGVVYNIEKATLAIKSIIAQLELQLGSKIAQIYIGINGQSMRTLKSSVVKDCLPDNVVKSEHIYAMADSNYNEITNDKSIALIDSIPQEYKMGADARLDPIGIKVNDLLEANYVNIIGRNSLIDNIELCFANIDVSIANYIPSQKAVAELLLSDEDRNHGCAFIDFGAETTTLSIYKSKVLRYFVVIPLGGNNLTKDLKHLKVDRNRAEVLKQSHGNVYAIEENSKNPQTIFLNENSKEEVTIQSINNLLKARQEEIIKNVWNQMQLSGYIEQINAGIIISGGASKMSGLIDLIKQICKTDRVKIAEKNDIEIEYSKIVRENFNKQDANRITIPLSLLLGDRLNCAPVVERTAPTLFEAQELIERQDSLTDKIAEEQEKLQLESERRAREMEEERARNKAIEEEQRRIKEQEERLKEKEKDKEKSGFIKLFKRVSDSFSSFKDSVTSDDDK